MIVSDNKCWIVTNHKCCAECTHWKPGSEFHASKKFFTECKGTCHAKKNIRKRWSYIPAFNCKFFKREVGRTFFVIGNKPISVHLLQIIVKDEQGTIITNNSKR